MIYTRFSNSTEPLARGFTLLELVFGMVSSGVLVVGLAAALYMSSKALDLNDTSSRQSAFASEVLGEMMADLSLARSFTERTATVVTFTVPDRTGDRSPETIRYAWTGTLGDPLTYQYNGEAPVTIARNVQNFSFSGLTRPMNAATVNVVVPPPEVVFEEYTLLQAPSNATQLAIDLPPGTSVGDLLIACVATDADTSAALTAEAGWTVAAVGQEGGTVTFGVWWKIAQGTETSTQLFSWDTGQKAMGWMMRFTGHDSFSPIQVMSTANGSNALPPSPAVITSTDDSMILRLGAFDNHNITIGNTGLTNSTTILMDESGSSGGNVSAGAGYTTQSSAGDSGTDSFALTSSQQYLTVTIAIAPDQSQLLIP